MPQPIALTDENIALLDGYRRALADHGIDSFDGPAETVAVEFLHQRTGMNGELAERVVDALRRMSDIPNPSEVYVPGVTRPDLMTDEQVAGEIAYYWAQGAEIMAEYAAQDAAYIAAGEPEMAGGIDPDHGARCCAGQRWPYLIEQAHARGLAL